MKNSFTGMKAFSLIFIAKDWAIEMEGIFICLLEWYSLEIVERNRFCLTCATAKTLLAKKNMNSTAYEDGVSIELCNLSNISKQLIQVTRIGNIYDTGPHIWWFFCLVR